MNIQTVGYKGVSQNYCLYKSEKSSVNFKSETGDILKKAYNSLTLKEKLALSGVIIASVPAIAGEMAVDSIKETASNVNDKIQQAKDKISDKVESYIDKKVNNFIDKIFK